MPDKPNISQPPPFPRIRVLQIEDSLPDAELVISEEVARLATLECSAFPAHELAVRNRAGRVGVRVIARVAELRLPAPLAS